MNNDLGIAVIAKAMSFGLKIGFDVEEVEYFTVVNDHNGVVFVEHRLLAAANVDDAEPAMPESDVVAKEVAFAVRPSMGHCSRHRFDVISVDARGWKTDYSCYAAHISET